MRLPRLLFYLGDRSQSDYLQAPISSSMFTPGSPAPRVNVRDTRGLANERIGARRCSMNVGVSRRRSEAARGLPVQPGDEFAVDPKVLTLLKQVARLEHQLRRPR